MKVTKVSELVVITGVSGGVGKVLAEQCLSAGFSVLGLDRNAPDVTHDRFSFYQIDLHELVTSANTRKSCIEKITNLASTHDSLHLINNAAVQLLGNFGELNPEAYVASFAVNAVAPAALISSLANSLASGNGSVINIGSIHSSLTKSGFAAYAASKAALDSITRSAAIEYGPYFKVNAIMPAAINTEMLRAGFEGNPDGLKVLESFHPSKSLGNPIDVANVALWLLHNKTKFLNGAFIQLNGAIGSLLHDPGNI